MADMTSLSGIGGFSTSQYTEYLTDQASAKTGEALKKTLNGTAKGNGATEEELMGACKQFEAYFLEQVFKSMMKPVDALKEANGFKSNSLVDYFQDTAIQDIAGSSTEKQGLGLAQELFENMKRNYNIGNTVSAEDAIAAQQEKDAKVARGIDPAEDKGTETVRYV